MTPEPMKTSPLPATDESVSTAAPEAGQPKAARNGAPRPLTGAAATTALQRQCAIACKGDA